jgi:hypothetical protein
MPARVLALRPVMQGERFYRSKQTPGVPSWLRPASVGCAVVVFVLLVALLAGVTNSDRLLGWGLDRLAGKVLAALPIDTALPTRGRLQQALACVRRAARDGRLDQQALGRLTRACTEALKDQHITAEELARIEALAIELCASSAVRVEQ